MGSNYCIFIPAATYVPTFIVARVVAPFITFGSTDSLVVGYLEDDLQRIVKTILEARPLLFLALAIVPTLVIATAPYYECLRERPLKACFPNIY